MFCGLWKVITVAGDSSFGAASRECFLLSSDSFISVSSARIECLFLTIFVEIVLIQDPMRTATNSVNSWVHIGIEDGLVAWKSTFHTLFNNSNLLQ